MANLCRKCKHHMVIHKAKRYRLGRYGYVLKHATACAVHNCKCLEYERNNDACSQN